MTDWTLKLDQNQIKKMAEAATKLLSDKASPTNLVKHFECTQCVTTKYFQTRQGLNRHKRAYHYSPTANRTLPAKEIACKECPNKYSSMGALRRHIRDRHSPEQAKPECSYCHKTWNRVELARKHTTQEHLGNATIIYTTPSPVIQPVIAYEKPFEASPRNKNRTTSKETSSVNTITIDLTKKITTTHQNKVATNSASPSTSPKTQSTKDHSEPKIVTIVGITKIIREPSTNYPMEESPDMETTTPREVVYNVPNTIETFDIYHDWIMSASTKYPPSDSETDDDDNSSPTHLDPVYYSSHPTNTQGCETEYTPTYTQCGEGSRDIFRLYSAQDGSDSTDEDD